MSYYKEKMQEIIDEAINYCDGVGVFYKDDEEAVKLYIDYLNDIGDLYVKEVENVYSLIKEDK